MTLRVKISLAMAVLAALIAIISGLAGYSLNQIDSRVHTMASDMNALRLLQSADSATGKALVAERSVIFLKPGSDDFEKNVNQHKQALATIDSVAKEFSNDVKNLQLVEQFDVYLGLVSNWSEYSNQVIDARVADTRAGRRTAIDVSFGSGADAFQALQEKLATIIDSTNIEAREQSESTYETMNQAKTAIFIGFIFAIGICGAIAWVLPRLIIGPIKEMTNVLEALATAGGDLKTELKIKTHDEIGALGKTFNRFIASLRELISDIITTTETVAGKASSLDGSAKNNQSVVQSSLGETNSLATAITQMSASISEVALNANATSESALQAKSESNSGVQIINETQAVINSLANEVGNSAEKISQLKQDTDKIHDVVSVIQGIAEQTNLLALNAAIEAARAGEQGRGFAVVADEVRALASRTQSSTEEIQQMVEVLQQSADSAHKTMNEGKSVAENSVNKANQAKNAFSEISAAIDSVSEMSIQIAASAEEQSSVSNEISENASRLSTYGQEAEVISTEVESLARETSDITQSLSHKLSIFKV